MARSRMIQIQQCIVEFKPLQEELDTPVDLTSLWRLLTPSCSDQSSSSFDRLSLESIDFLLNDETLNLVNRYCPCKVCVHHE